MVDLSLFGKIQSVSNLQRQKEQLALKQQLMAMQREQDRQITPYQQEMLGMKKAEMEQEGMFRNRQLDMMKARINAASAPSPNNAPDGTAPMRKLSATEQKAFEETQQQLQNIDNAMGAFSQIKEYQNKPMYSGAGAGIIAGANDYPIIGGFVDDTKAANTTAYQNLVLQGQYAQLKNIFPGAISNAERTALENLGALATYSPAKQKEIIKNAETGLTRLKGLAAQRAADIASGDQYINAINTTKAKPVDLRLPDVQEDNDPLGLRR
jgi:hypothetical protein